jgi:trans-2,3-dihydro-3-hydroxyanthranilate isomerase
VENKFGISQIDAFTAESFKGNPAGVMFADGITDENKRLIAKEMNLSETAFLSKSDKADYKLQWFTPAVEVELCGHATIASLHFLHENNLLKKNQEVKFDTLSGVLNCGYDGVKYYMQIPVPQLSVYDGYKKEILAALGLTLNDIDENVPFLITNLGYIFIYVKNLDAVGKLKPDFSEIKRLSILNKKSIEIVVFSLETIEKENFAHLRFFAPDFGIDEDPVTGSANGPFILVLAELGLLKLNDDVTTKTFEQGDFVGRPGRVTVKYNKPKNEIYISGKAKTVIKGEITL